MSDLKYNIEVDGLKAGYDGKVVLEDVSFKVKPGEIRVILGTSGCGKSTLMNNILGLYRPLEGKINYLGTTIDASKEKLSKEQLMRTGVLFQAGALLSSLTVAQNVALPLRIHNPGLDPETVKEIVCERLSLVNMLHAYDKLPSELSGGMRKRAALARSIATEPEVLFCDEPSAGLDPVTSRALDELLLHLRDQLGVSILIVTHELDSIRTICDRLIYLHYGKVLLDGTLDEALNSEIPEIKNFFARKMDEDREKSNTMKFNFED